MCPVKIQIRLRICAVWSESSLTAFWIALIVKFLYVEYEDSAKTVRVAEILSFLFYFSTTRLKKHTAIILFVIYSHSLISQQNLQNSIFLYTLRQVTAARATPSHTWSIITMRSHIRRYFYLTLAQNTPSRKHSYIILILAGLGGSVGCAVRLETKRSRVQPPPRSATFFRGDWSWNIFYGHSLPSADSRRAVVSFWRKNVHNIG